MDTLKKLSRDAQIVLGGSVLYIIVSFFDWQQVSYLNVHAGISEWHGVGVIAGLLGVAVLAWEAVRLSGARLDVGPVTAEQGSVGLALLLLLFTVITFLTHNEARHWPSWVGLVLSIAIATAAFRRGRAEGVRVPDMSAIKTEIATRTKSDNSAAPTVPADPPADSEANPNRAPGTTPQPDA